MKKLLSIALSMGILSVMAGVAAPVFGSEMKQPTALEAVQTAAAAPVNPELLYPVRAPEFSTQIPVGGSVPEPGDFALFGTGLLALAALLRWKMSSAAKGRDITHQALSLVTDRDKGGENLHNASRKEPKAVTPARVRGKAAAGGNAA